MAGSSDAPETGVSVPKETKLKFIRGILIFYAVNFAAMLAGLKATELLGNAEGITLMLVLMLVFQVVLGYLVLKKGKSIIP